MQALFHIVAARTWASVGAAYEPASLRDEGFIHFSFRDQVAATVRARYAGVPGLIVLEVDPDRLDAPVVVEDSYGSGTQFPHLYGPLPRAAVRATHPVGSF